MSGVYRLLVQVVLPVALVVAVALAWWRIDVPWYVFGFVLPGCTFFGLVLVGVVGRARAVGVGYGSSEKNRRAVQKRQAVAVEKEAGSQREPRREVSVGPIKSKKDEELVALARCPSDKDEADAAWGELYERYATAGAAFLERKLRLTFDQAEDAVHTFFAKLLASETYDPGRPFRAYFFCGVWHEGLSRQKSEMRRAARSVSLDQFPDEADEAADREAELHPRLATLEACLEEMSERDAWTMQLLNDYYRAEETLSVIASRLGVSIATVSRRLEAARKSLHACVERKEKSL